MGWKKYQLPFLESQIQTLGLFEPPFQKVVMEVRAQLALLHEDIDQARFYVEKTFDSSLSDQNFKNVNQGLDGLTATIGKRVRQIVDLIGTLSRI